MSLACGCPAQSHSWSPPASASPSVWWASPGGCSFHHLSPLFSLDGNDGVQDGVFLPAVNIQGGTLGSTEVEPHPLSCLGADIQHLLQVLSITSKEDQVIHLGQDT